MDIYRDLPPAALMGLAARELAGKLQSIEHLNLSPDLLGSLLERVLGAQARKLGGRQRRGRQVTALRAAAARGRGLARERARRAARCATARCSRRASSSASRGGSLDEVLTPRTLRRGGAARGARRRCPPSGGARASARARARPLPVRAGRRRSSSSGRTGSSPTWPSTSRAAGHRHQPVDGAQRRRAGAPPPQARRRPAARCSRAAGWRTEERTMVRARLDDGQTLLALNEIFVGHRTHQSARATASPWRGRARAPVVVGADRGDRDRRDRLGREHRRDRAPALGAARAARSATSPSSCARRGRAWPPARRSPRGSFTTTRS